MSNIKDGDILEVIPADEATGGRELLIIADNDGDMGICIRGETTEEEREQGEVDLVMGIPELAAILKASVIVQGPKEILKHCPELKEVFE